LAGTYSLYVDGARQVANGGTYVRADPAATPLYWFIGHSETTATSTDSWTGLLDDVRIYNRILNYNDARALYFVVAQPSLSVVNNSGALTLSWPRGAAGFHLQSADALAPSPSWPDV